jgi:hypothetical protein
MRYEKPRFETFADFRRFMVRVFVLLYLVALSGVALRWHLEGGSLWPYLATAVVAAPCMALGYYLGVPRAKYLFETARRKMTIPETK